MADAVAAKEIPGAVILVGRGDRVLFREAVGARALVPRREPLSVDTVFDVASLTKAVATAPAILALWEQGKIDLDAPLGRYLKEFDRKAFAGVTIRRILTHSAGFPDLPPRQAMRRQFPAAASTLAAMGLYATPGSTFRYSDTGFILLGEVVRRVSGEPLDVFARRRFFAPLGMKHTAFAPPRSWRSQIAPTEAVGRGMLRGVVHDGNARLLDGVAGHAGLFSTADDLARFCRMLLAGGAFGKHRVLAASTVRAMLEGQVIGESTRALGWDMASSYSGTLGAFFPQGSVGHTGFTGTALWMDPGTRTYLIILTNRVHPYGKGEVAELRRRVSAIVGARMFGHGDPPEPLDLESPTAPAADPEPLPASEKTRSGLDVLAAQGFALLDRQTVAVVTNQTGIDARGRRIVDLLAAAPGVKVRAIFTPEHGITGLLDEHVPHGRDAATGLPIWSLYGPARRPTAAMLAGVDTLVFDIQDVGVRYYTYLSTLVYVLEEAARRGIRVVVLDRPNPSTGRVVEGPLMDADLRSFTAPHPLPVRTGMTIGEFAQMVVGERGLKVSLTVVPLQGWHRGRWYDETGLPWTNPSPNIRSPLQALLYAGVGLLEATNLSVGRGTDMPFEVVGAPWVADPAGLARGLGSRGLAGVAFQPVEFTPTANVFAGETVRGVRLLVTDREAIRPVQVGLAMARELIERYPTEFRPAAIQNLLVHRSTVWALLRAEPLARIWRWAEAEEEQFLQRRAAYLIYR
jgi:uncharacterized protein YbbC (DUF1343 family)